MMAAELKPYDTMKESRLGWLEKVPTHWNELPLKRVARVDNSGSYGEEPENGECVLPVATTAQIDREGQFSVADMPRRGFSHENADRYRCQAGDILVVKSSGSIFNVVSGKAGIVDPRLPAFAFSNFLLRVAAIHSVVNPRFLFATLSGHLTRERIKRMVTGSTYPNLKVKEYSSALLPIPPLAEQAAIGRFLDHADRHIRRYIRAKERLIELLEEQRQAIIHQAVTGQIDVRTGQPYPVYKDSGVEWVGKVPEHWEVRRLGQLIDLTVGFPFKSDGFTQARSDVRLLRGVNVAPGTLRWDDVVRWPIRDVDSFEDYAMEVGDIVLGMDRPIIQAGTRVAVVSASDVPSLLLQRVARIRVKEDLRGDYAFELIGGKGFSDYLAPIFTGISVPHLSAEQVKNYRFAFPNVAEQHAIMHHVASRTSAIRSAARRILQQIHLLREFRTRLIADVVTGKLDVRAAAADLPEGAPVGGRSRGETIHTESHPLAIEYDMAKEAIL